MNTIVVQESNIRLGNWIYLILYYGAYYNGETLYVYHNCKYIVDYYKIFKNVIFKYDQNLPFKPLNNYDEFENSNIDKNIIDLYINYEYLNNIKYTNYICIHCRRGDFLSQENTNIFNEYNDHFHNLILTEYKDIFNVYDKIVIISDNINDAYEIIGDNIFNHKVIYEHNDVLTDLSLLIHANCIIGSCSTFSFIGCLLNVNNAKMYVKYPFYKIYNSNLWAYTGENLYNNKNIIKIF